MLRVSAEKGTISIRNRYDFQTLSHLKCICTLESCGSVRWEKEVPIDGIAPQSEQEIKLFEKGEIPGGDGLPEAWICLRFIYRENPRWYQGSGPLEAAFHQERLVQAAEVDNILPKDMAADLSAVTKVQESTQGTLSGEMKMAGCIYRAGISAWNLTVFTDGWTDIPSGEKSCSAGDWASIFGGRRWITTKIWRKCGKITGRTVCVMWWRR